ncbi:hypothetical protein DOY81_007020 [Sarcophaga bullata]|nr:hypothetical protein DOY81_007020 [Sarcophaga bullata]
MALKQNSAIWQHFINIEEEGMAECKLCKHRLRNNRSYNLKQHLRKVHNEKNKIWDYFDNYVEEGVAQCKTCKRRMQNRTCNLRLHMRRSHNIEVEPAKLESLNTIPPLPYNEERIRAVLKVARRKMVDNSHLKENQNKKQRIFVKMDKSIIIRSVLGFVVEDKMTLNTIGSNHMQSILQPLCAAITEDEGKEFKVDVPETERMLALVANLIRNDFSNELHWRLLSLKIENDLFASPNTFLLTAMFIDKSQIQKRILGIINLENDEQLTECHIKDTLHKYNIDSNQIISAYWDNTKSNYHKHISNSEYLSEIENFEKYPDIQLGDIKVERYIGTMAHQCVLDVLKNPNIFKQFLECRNLVKFISDETNGYYELFEKHELPLPQLDSPWKYGSTHQMIAHLSEARSILDCIKYEQPDEPEDRFDMNDNMWSFIDAFRKYMNIIQKSIIKFYGEEMHCGDFYAQWLKCRLITEKYLSAETKADSCFHIILNELSNCIETRMQMLLTQDRYVACLYLDPRFQRTLNSPQKSIALEYLKKLWSRARLYNFEIVGKDTENLEDISIDDPSVDEDEDAFLNEFLSQDVQIKDNKTADVYRKIENLKLSFQMVDTNILLFWKGQQQTEPEMHALSSICLAIPATQNYCKINFNDFIQLESDENLSDFTKKHLLFLRLNPEQLTNAVKRLDLTKEDHSNESVSCESDSEDDNSNAASTSTAYSNDISAASKRSTVH